MQSDNENNKIYMITRKNKCEPNIDMTQVKNRIQHYTHSDRTSESNQQLKQVIYKCNNDYIQNQIK